MATIDLEKTSDAYDYLAETDEGRSALAEFQSAIEGLKGAIQPNLNQGEFVTVLRGLAQGMTLEDVDEDEVSGFGSFGAADMQRYQAGELRSSGVPQAVQFAPRLVGSFKIQGVA